VARLSLCLIARDEERMLPGCLASVRGLADEVVVVDTGSRDGTREIAVRAGARVYDRPWDDDFSAPRNLALAGATGDWVLQLDADERLAPGAAAGIRRALARRDLDLGLVWIHDAASEEADPADVVSGRRRHGRPLPAPRLMRRRPGLEYRGIVHETVEDSLADLGGRLEVLPDVHVAHLGGAPAHRAALAKRERNIALLERRRRMEPDALAPVAWLAVEYWQSGRPDDAERAAVEGWARVDGRSSPIAVHMLGVSLALASMRRGDASSARKVAERLLRAEGRSADAVFLLGHATEATARAEPPGGRRRELLEAAERLYQEALGKRSRPEVYMIVDGADSWAALLRRATVLLLLERPEEAAAEFRAARLAGADEGATCLGELEAMLDAGDAGGALAGLERLLDARPDGWVLAAAAARALGAREEARLFLARAAERVPAGFVSNHRAARQAAMMRDPP
jgi:tetratricopeptide (TPR) repeat protein